MFKIFLPNKIFNTNHKMINGLIILTLVIILIGIAYALFISPSDYIQGDSVRIMYVHVPASFLSLGFFGILGMISVLNLIFKIKILPYIGKSIAPIGFVFALVSILTGSLWGKPTWGVWWAWDARLTSMLVLLIFYLTYILIWKFVENFNTANTINCFVAIVGSFNIPVIKYSVDWWNTLHQTSSITLTSAPTIHYSMLAPLIIMILGFFLYSLVIFLMRYKTELIKLKLNKKNKKTN
tara:strand:- start:875 stop:1588 length:714 start_codon:yes stop_codon:yes gene_type:complete